MNLPGLHVHINSLDMSQVKRKVRFVRNKYFLIAHVGIAFDFRNIQRQKQINLMFHLMLNRFSWQCLNISLDVSTDPSLKWCSSNWAALIPFGWLLNQGWVPREALLIPLPNASTTSPSSYTKLRYIKLYQTISYILYTKVYYIC